LERILDFSVQISQRRRLQISKEKSKKYKDFHAEPQDLHSEHRHFTLENVQFKGFLHIPHAFHTQGHQDFAWVKLSEHPHQTISPLSCTLKTFTSADAYRMWKFMDFSSSKMYSLTFYSTINVLILPTSRIF